MNTRPLKKLLYVEDEIDIQTVAKLALEAIGGFTLHVCSSGHDAVAQAEAFAPDLILLDVMMPGMDGPTTLAALRLLPNLTETPVIFMTAKVQAQEVAQYLVLGAAGVIAKPFDPMTLSDKVIQIWQSVTEKSAA